MKDSSGCAVRSHKTSEDRVLRVWCCLCCNLLSRRKFSFLGFTYALLSINLVIYTSDIHAVSFVGLNFWSVINDSVMRHN